MASPSSAASRWASRAGTTGRTMAKRGTSASACRAGSGSGTATVRPAAAGARLGRYRPRVRPRARALLYLVELPLAGLDKERPRPPARPYVGFPVARAAHRRAQGARAVPGVAAAVGPCAADLRSPRLSNDATIRRAIAALKAGR